MADDEHQGALGNPLRVEDDEYGTVEEVPLSTVAVAPTAGAAGDLARRLVEHGLGATVVPAGDAAGFEVRVLPGEAGRAGAVLAGTAPGEEEVAAEPGPGAPVPWKALLAIWVAAMLIIPVVAGVGTYLLTR